jgi:hypothetical protein
MSTTDNLQITKIEVGQYQKETTMNQALDDLDAAISDALWKSVAGSSDVTLTDAESLSMVQEYTGTLTGDINVIVPARNKLWIIHNNTDGAYSLTVKTSSGIGVTVSQGTRVIAYCDGSHVVNVTDEVVAVKGMIISDTMLINESVTVSIAYLNHVFTIGTWRIKLKISIVACLWSKPDMSVGTSGKKWSINSINCKNCC